MQQSFFIKTYGCQMNQYDSEKLMELLKFNGYKQSPSIDDTDVAILNTCHIREKAAEKLYSDLGRLSKFKENKKKIGRKMHIVVTGCVAQAEGDEILKRNKNVDFIFGPQNFHKLPTAIKNESEQKVYDNFLSEEKFKSFIPSSNKQFSRLLTIQEGCDKFCSFCVVPYTRGSEFSRSVEDVFAEASLMVNNGAKEITLLGQNVSSYTSKVLGRGEDKKVSLGSLCEILSKIAGLKRIRYLTSHPNDIDESLIFQHQNNLKMMPFLHLPIQSGSDEILKKMNRKHTREFYINLVENIKKRAPKMQFSSDFIVGYPGESDNDFDETIDLIKKVKFASSFSFKYSPRPGTPAALNEKQVSEEKANLRLKIIQKILNDQQKYFNESFIDKEVEVLFTERGKKSNQFVGRTQHLQPVHVFSNTSLLGNLQKVKIQKLTSFSFHGILKD